MYTPNPIRLAALLRGQPAPKFEHTTWADIEPEPPRGGLPRALALWESQRAEREAEELRRATTPRAWVDGEELTLTMPEAAPDTSPEPDTLTEE